MSLIPHGSSAMSTSVLVPARGSTVLFEGDSLTGFRIGPGLDTWAWQRLTNAAYGYPERVGDWIFCNRPELRLSVRLGAVGGATMGEVLGRWEATASLRPAVVVLTIGTNDAGRGVSSAALGAQVDDFCTRLTDHCGGRVLYLGGLTACHGLSPEAATRRLAAVDHYAAVAAAVSANNGLVVDLGTVLARRATDLAALWAGHTIFHDGSHFNAVGNEIVAATVLQALGLMTIL